MTIFFIIMILMLVNLSSIAFAEEDDDLEIFGLELEKLLNLGSGLLAIGLLALTIIAYERNKNTRLLYVSAAFFFFAVKGLLMSTELLFEHQAPNFYIGPLFLISLIRMPVE